MEKKWCGFHQKFESIEHFQKNAFKKSGYQDHCREGQKVFTDGYNSSHREAINEKCAISQKFYSGLITRTQQIALIKRINKKYGIVSRISA
jgi:hypothetical protein